MVSFHLFLHRFRFVELKSPIPSNLTVRTWDFIFFQSEQPRDLAFGIHVDIDGGGLLGQTGHGHNVAADDHHETGTGGKADQR